MPNYVSVHFNGGVEMAMEKHMHLLSSSDVTKKDENSDRSQWIHGGEWYQRNEYFLIVICTPSY